jgi:hypothetical protein
MSDTERRLADIEKRLARVEKLTEPKIGRMVPVPGTEHPVVMQWCDCGRDVCRAPDCPTQKKDGA